MQSAESRYCHVTDSIHVLICLDLVHPFPALLVESCIELCHATNRCIGFAISVYLPTQFAAYIPYPATVGDPATIKLLPISVTLVS